MWMGRTTIDYRNAQGNQDTLSSIADYYVGQQVDLILAIATPSAGGRRQDGKHPYPGHGYHGL